MQQGRYAAREEIRDRLRGREPSPFHYRDKGNLATIGRAKAVADIKGLHLSGLLAWLTWLFVHLFYQIARRVGCSPQTVKKWRGRYERHGLGGLADAPRPGRPLVHGTMVRARLIALACTRPPETPEGLRRERWTHWQLAVAVGMSESQAHQILRCADIKPHLLEQWMMRAPTARDRARTGLSCRSPPHRRRGHTPHDCPSRKTPGQKRFPGPPASINCGTRVVEAPRGDRLPLERVRLGSTPSATNVDLARPAGAGMIASRRKAASPPT